MLSERSKRKEKKNNIGKGKEKWSFRRNGRNWKYPIRELNLEMDYLKLELKSASYACTEKP